jgi:uncharacterized protein
MRDSLAQSATILNETADAIERILGREAKRLTVERAVVGLFFTGVKLSSGAAGACATPLHSIPEAVCCPSSAMAMPFPGKLCGRSALELVKETSAKSGIRRAVGVAVTNALAEMCWSRRPHPAVDRFVGVDAYNAAKIEPGERVVVVGAFMPFLRALKQARQAFTVLEMDPRTLKPDELQYFRPADQAAAVVPEADVVLITGTTLLNGTLEGLLSLCRDDARVVLIGPTVSLLPDAYLRRGVDILGSIRVTAPDEFLDVLSEGGSGYHFFGRSAERVVLIRRPAAAELNAA